MTELLTAAQMRAIEQAAIASGQVTGLELMERAGRGVVEAIFEEWPELRATSHRAVVLCGPGNNGGDGFVVARLLKEWGWEVEVFLYGDPERLPLDARVNCERWAVMGEVKELTERAFRAPHPIHGNAYSDLYVDAIFGAGISRPLTGEALDVLTHMSGRGGDDYASRTVAIDAPSGMCLDSGCALGKSSLVDTRGYQAMAALTVTFEAAKPGHYLGTGPEACGKVVVKPIGLQPWLFMDKPVKRGGSWSGVLKLQRLHRLSLPDKEFNHLNPGQWGRVGVPFLFRLGRSRQHKYSHGHAVILCGPSGRGGAARLAARGALRIGAGVVTLGCPPEAIPENAARLDAVMLRPIADADVLARVLEDARINALCLGPGMGLSDETRALTAQGLKSGRKLVLDADALTLIARDASLFAGLHDGCVLTPHAGEFARLFPDIAEKLAAPATKGPAYSKVDAAREAAARAGCVVLFKGPDTVIAGPDGRCAINSAHYDRSAPWLATAGSGDVLAGFIIGLLARGFSPFDAACTGAWLHVECARSFGPGLIAEDLPEELPKVFRALGL
ncbi:NAD(P)H-hydrate dehydratase [Rhodobacter sp. Har01]|uniref:NAD(P)H-hydrate dehydratase n=1 Tax=Rhodobacter sp. Har01 TaxID=2883999 RepID=UPI001D092FA3|nr:NAD(P)H-hydrate dehydratase [Rhodobacter sp. Har01]MCB6177426.1 NAD(P)H-hydrate dehydratase [Rhodobacter sp. Har01]